MGEDDAGEKAKGDARQNLEPPDREARQAAEEVDGGEGGGRDDVVGGGPIPHVALNGFTEVAGVLEDELAGGSEEEDVKAGADEGQEEECEEQAKESARGDGHWVLKT